MEITVTPKFKATEEGIKKAVEYSTFLIEDLHLVFPVLDVLKSDETQSVKHDKVRLTMHLDFYK